MLVVLFTLLVISLLICSSKFNFHLPANGEYISRERTSIINGFFIWMVFLSHINGYNFNLPLLDKILLTNTVGNIGQCVVATFFFFSGYGIMLSLTKKGTDYAITLLTRRFCLLLLHFSLAVLIFTGVNYLLGKTFSPNHILLSLIGWDSVGNSNWFIFITLIGYLFIASSYLLLHKYGNLLVVSAVLVLFSLLIPFLSFKGYWWVDTCLCIPAGMYFCIARTTVERILTRIMLPPCLVGLAIMLVGIAVYKHIHLYNYGANIGAILFATGVMFIFSALSLKRVPAFLCWSGSSALFFLYIFQRIPMMVGAYLGWHTNHPYLYEFFCIAITIALAWVSVRAFNRLDSLIINIFHTNQKFPKKHNNKQDSKKIV